MSSPRLEMGPVSNNAPSNPLVIEVNTLPGTEQEQLKPFLRWLHADVLKNNPGYCEKLFGALGYFIGALSTYSSYPLGEDFVEDELGATSSVTQALKIPVGIISFIPTAALLARPTQAEFLDLASWLLKKPQLPTRQEHKILKGMATATAHFLAAFTGVPFYILMQPYFSGIPFLDFFAPFTAIISSYCGTIRVERTIIEDYFVRVSREEAFIKDARIALDTKINAALKTIKAKNDEALKIFYAEIQALIQEQNATTAATRVLKKLLNNSAQAGAETCLENPGISLATPKKTWQKTLLDIAVILTGALSTYIFYSLSIQTAELVFGSLDETEEEALNNSVAVLAIASNAVFDAMYAKFDTDKGYQAYVNGRRIPDLQTVVAHIIAACSSIPNTYVAIRDAGNPFEQDVVPTVTFVGSTLARAEAFSELIDSCFKHVSKNSPRVIRANLNTMLEKIRRAVWLVPAETVMALHATLIPAQIPASPAIQRSVKTPTSASLNHAAFFAQRSRSASLPLSKAPELRRAYSC